MNDNNHKQQSLNRTTSLQALTAAALVLPGLLHTPVHAAEEDSVDFQYRHYQEGKRDIYGLGLSGIQKLPQNLNPIEVDSVHGSGRFTLTDRIKFAFNYTQDTWSGATPIGTAPSGANGNNARYSQGGGTSTVSGALPYAYFGNVLAFFIDRKLNAYQTKVDSTLGQLVPSGKDQLTHVLSYASPETRKQGDFKLGYQWDDAALDIGGGISIENDYESRFASLGGRFDFNKKQTTLNWGVSYTNSDTFATLDPDALSFISTEGYDNTFCDFNDGTLLPQPVDSRALPAATAGYIESSCGFDNANQQFARTNAVLRGNRQDWGAQLGLTQVLDKNSLVSLDLGYTRSTGYLANPYKVVYAFKATFNPGQDFALTDGPNTSTQGAFLEVRPDERNQFNWHLGYDRYIEPLDAALHFDYSFAHDDWGINAHTFEADWVQPLGFGWVVTPRIRYYSQSAADFYTTGIFQVNEAILDSAGNQIGSTLVQDFPKNYSSDQRLSGFGTLSGGVTLNKQFAKGINLETGFEYYTHQGSLKIGGGGEQAFADFDYWVANAALKVNLGALNAGGGGHGAWRASPSCHLTRRGDVRPHLAQSRGFHGGLSLHAERPSGRHAAGQPCSRLGRGERQWM